MGQSATLYGIDKNDFPKILDNPKDPGLIKLSKYYETFEKTFDALLFLISKGHDSKVTALVNQIFYPNTFVGEKIDFVQVDLENLPEDFDFENQPIYYNASEKVVEISTLLESLSSEAFSKRFDSNELNKADVYPGGVWNNQANDDIAFNTKAMTKEYERLKTLFATAKSNGDYLLSFIG